MKFLANENVPFDAVSALQETGHDVIWVRVSAPGSSDDPPLLPDLKLPYFVKNHRME